MRDDLIRYIIKRLAFLPIFIFIVSFIVFFMLRLAPGDPVLLRVHAGASEEAVERIRHELGLDKPLPMQYVYYMKDFFTGDLGESFVLKPDEKITDLIVPRMLISAPINLMALGIAFTFGTALGLLASFKRGTWIDYSVIGIFLLFASIHSIILVQFMILIFAVKLQWLPAGWTGDWHSVFSLNAVIPVFTIALLAIASVARFVRTTTLIVIDENYVRTAKAKGLPGYIVATKYVLRNSLLPLVTMIVPAILLCWVGSLFIERIYGIPGMGVFMVEAVFARDYDIITSLGMIIALVSVIAYLIVDIIYKFLDPRVDLTKRM